MRRKRSPLRRPPPRRPRRPIPPLPRRKAPRHLKPSPPNLRLRNSPRNLPHRHRRPSLHRRPSPRRLRSRKLQPLSSHSRP
ncbi:MAG: hypothetical protein DWH91_07525 [Planctomycetota bacterium]|nr:MAG: hypothetical protein DWH91_07525 [Planctomycetota bacterium]